VKVGIITISADDNAQKTVAEQFEFKQNYPNSFNPSTTIEYQVPEYSNASIVIFSVLGKEIKRMVNADKSPGDYRLVGDSRDKEGRRVASGPTECGDYFAESLRDLMF